MKNRPFIPKPLRKYSWTIWRQYTWIDLIILFFWAVLSVFIPLSFELAVWQQIIIILSILFFYPIIVIPFNQEKLYFRIYHCFCYLFSKKIYFKWESKMLDPYKKIDEKTGIIQTKNNKRLKIVELKGFNLSLLQENERVFRVSSFQNFIKQNYAFSLVSVLLPLDYDNQEKTINDVIKKHQKNKSLHAVSLLEKSIFNKLLENKTNYGNKYFVVIEGSSDKDVNNKYHSSREFLEDANLFPEEIKDKNQLETIIKALNLDFKNKKVSFRRNYFKKDKTFQKVLSTRNLPTQAFSGWIFILNKAHDLNWVIKVDKMDKIKATKKLNWAISDLQADLQKNKKASEGAQKTLYLEGLEELNSLVHMGGEEFESIKIFISVTGETKKELKKKIKDLRFNLLSYSVSLHDMTWRQQEALSSMFLGTKTEKAVPSAELSSLALAWGFPFVSDEHLDPKGLYLGYSKTSHRNIFFDPRIRDDQRMNGNTFILGTSGGGKSTTSKKLIKNQILAGDKIFCLDPEREYDYLCENLGGDWINFGVDNSLKDENKVINPLQFLQNETGDRDLLQTHLQFLEEFFRTLFPELNQKELNFLRLALLKAYTRKRIRSSNSFKRRRNNSYPLLEEVVDIIKDLLDKEQDQFNIPIWKNLLVYMGVFRTKTPEASMWNGYTNFNIYDGYLTVADLQTLFASGNARLANAQMFLLLKLVNHAMIQNKNLKDRKLSNRSFGIVIDEAHLLIDERQPFALNFMYEMSKRARKYNAYVVITTQNVSDFIGSNKATRDKTSAILNVSQYGFILPMTSGDINDLDKLLKASGGLMDQEKSAVELGKKGQVLLMNGSKNRQIIQIDVADEEFLLWEK